MPHWFQVPGTNHDDRFCTNSPNADVSMQCLIAVHTLRGIHMDQAAESGEKVVNKAGGYDGQLLTTLGVKTQLEYANHENIGYYEDEKPTAREIKLFGKVLRGFVYDTKFNIQLSEVAAVYAISRIDVKQAKMHTDYMASQNAFVLLSLDKDEEERTNPHDVSYLEFMRSKDNRNSLYRPHQLAQVNLLNEFLQAQGVAEPINTELLMEDDELAEWGGDQHNLKKVKVVYPTPEEIAAFKQHKKTRKRGTPKMKPPVKQTMITFTQPFGDRFNELARIVKNHAAIEAQFNNDEFSKAISLRFPRIATEYRSQFQSLDLDGIEAQPNNG